MKYTVDTEGKTIEIEFASSEELIELAKKYDGYNFKMKEAQIVVPQTYPIYPQPLQPYYTDPNPLYPYITC